MGRRATLRAVRLSGGGGESAEGKVTIRAASGPNETDGTPPAFSVLSACPVLFVRFMLFGLAFEVSAATPRPVLFMLFVLFGMG